MWDSLSKLGKTKKYIQILCNALEMVMAVLMLIGLVLSIFSLVRNVEFFQILMADASAIKQYMDQIFMIVIGIEFLVMLCRPNSENVIDVLIFLVARHMIVGDTSPYQDFVSVISVTLLCIVRRYLRNNKENREEKKYIDSSGGSIEGTKE